jgi:hypothetical protein
MKFALILGGLIGFLIGAGSALWEGVGSSRIFLDGALGCLAGGLLLRWLWRVLITCVHQSLLIRQQANAEAIRRTTQQDKQ